MEGCPKGGVVVLWRETAVEKTSQRSFGKCFCSSVVVSVSQEGRLNVLLKRPQPLISVPSGNTTNRYDPLPIIVSYA
jgi:hypothetical protein